MNTRFQIGRFGLDEQEHLLTWSAQVDKSHVLLRAQVRRVGNAIGGERRYRIYLSCAIALIMMFATFTGRAAGQTASFSGTVTGIVTDGSGAVVPGAAAIARNVATGLETKSQSNNDGIYTIPGIATGLYVVRIEAKGFKVFEKQGILIDPNSVVKFDCVLQIGNETQTVEVTEEAPLLEIEQTTLDQTISHEFVESQPNVVSSGIRDMTALLDLAPGVAQGANFYAYNIASGRAFTTELELDGVPIVYSAQASVPLTNKPDQDIISEVQVQMGVPSAEYGHSSGGIGTFTSRFGTGEYHGDVALLLRNTVLDAKPYNSLTKTQDQQFEMPISIGGPVIIPHLYNGRQKSFFFFNYSSYRKHSAITPSTTTVPTALMRQGNFSELAAGNLIYDPTTGQPFPAIPSQVGCSIGKCIPQGRFSAFSQAYMKLIPLPTNNNVTANYIGRTPNAQNENHYFGKIDQRIGKANTLHGSIRWDNTLNELAVGPFGASLGTWTLPEVARALNLSDDTVIRPNLVNSISIAYSRWTLISQGTNPSLSPGQIPGTYGSGFPVVNFESIYGSPIGFNSNLNLTTPFWNFNDAVNWTEGRHNLKIGARYSDYIEQQGTSLGQENGTYYFGASESGHGLLSQGDPFASFLLGDVDSANIGYPGKVGFSSQYYALFGQDSLRISKRLTANIGMRWDIQRPFNQPNSYSISLTTPNPGAGNLPGAAIFTGMNGTGGRYMPTWFGGVAPRVGLAWNPASSTVLRVGYGIMYAPLEYILTGPATAPGTAAASPSPGVAALQWDAGFAPSQVIPTTVTLSPTLLNGKNGVALDPTRGRSDRLTDSQNVQLDIEQSWRGAVFDAAYIGQFTHHIIGSNGADAVTLANINQLPVADLKYGTLLTSQISDPAVAAAGFRAPYLGFTGTLAQALRPYPEYLTLAQYIPIGNSTYHAFVLKAEKRLSQGLQFLASYTISKELTDATTTVAPLPAPQDQYNRRFEKSVAVTDIPRVLNLSYLYELPVGHGKGVLSKGVWGRVLEGFFVSGNQVYQAGTPVQISSPVNDLPIFSGVLHLSRGQGSFTTGGRGSIKIGNSLYGTTGTTYLNQAAFAEPPSVLIPDPNNPNQEIANPAVIASPSAALGNLKYVLPNVRTLGYFNENLHIGKRQSIRDRYAFEFGVDFIDAFNRTDFGGLNTTYGTSGFGTYTSAANGPRVIQLNSRLTF